MPKIKTTLGVIKNFQNWGTFFADHFKLIKNKKIVYRFRNGIRYKTRAGTVDKNIINETWLHNVYTPENFQIRRGDVVVDVGAHIGAFSILAAKHATEGRIFSFEPVPENFEMLKENILLNELDNVIAINKAVSDKSGNKKIFLSNKNTGRHSLYFHQKGADSIEIETLSLNDFISKNKIKQIDFLKMDCEGAEYPILFNASSDILKRIQKISMECHNVDEKNNVDNLRSFLEKNGFSVKIKFGEKPNYSMLYAMR